MKRFAIPSVFLITLPALLLAHSLYAAEPQVTWTHVTTSPIGPAFWSQDSADKERALIEPSKRDQFLKGLKPGIYRLYFKETKAVYPVYDFASFRYFTSCHNA